MSGHERGVSEWEELFKQADSRYKFLGATPAPNSKMWLIEAEWTGWRIWASEHGASDYVASSINDSMSTIEDYGDVVGQAIHAREPAKGVPRYPTRNTSKYLNNNTTLLPI